MSDMKEMIVDSATKIFEKYSTKEVVNDAEQGHWARELWKTIDDYGMLGVGVPEKLGGSGGDFDDALSILRLAGKYSTPIPLAETFIANWLLASLGVSIANEILTISADKNRQLLQLQENGQGWIVTGRAKNVPWARFAKKFVVFGETSEGPVLAIVPLENAEIMHGKNLAGEARDEVIFNDVFIEN